MQVRKEGNVLAKVWYRYGSMNSSKSMNLIASAYNYINKGDNVLVFKPETDTKSSTGKIESRAGVSIECIDINDEVDIFSFVEFMHNAKTVKPISCIFVDEVQFLTRDQIFQLINIAYTHEIPVITYGLRTDFIGRLFPATEILLAHADKIEEIKTVCHIKGCGKKSLYNERLKDGIPVFDGDSVLVGDVKEEESSFSYRPLCRKHYMDDICDSLK